MNDMTLRSYRHALNVVLSSMERAQSPELARGVAMELRALLHQGGNASNPSYRWSTIAALLDAALQASGNRIGDQSGIALAVSYLLELSGFQKTLADLDMSREFFAFLAITQSMDAHFRLKKLIAAAAEDPENFRAFYDELSSRLEAMASGAEPEGFNKAALSRGYNLRSIIDGCEKLLIEADVHYLLLRSSLSQKS